MKESVLYRPVAGFLEKRYGCDRKKTWTAGCGKKLAFPSGFGEGIPDVVAVRHDAAESQVHLVEGKLLGLRTHAFEEARNQLDNRRPYADMLWAVFPEEQWRQCASHHDSWIGALRERGYGLLLVSERLKVSMKFEAGLNRQVNRARREELLEELVGPLDRPVKVRSLGSDLAKAAARALARVVELMAGPVKLSLAPRRREGQFIEPSCYDSEGDFVLIGSAWNGDVLVQGDPFGLSLGDGRPVIWVWRHFGELKGNEKKIRDVVNRQLPEDTFFWAENDDGDCDACRAVSELDVASLKASRHDSDFFFGRAIPVDDRSNAAVEKDFRRLHAWAKHLGNNRGGRRPKRAAK